MKEVKKYLSALAGIQFAVKSAMSGGEVLAIHNDGIHMTEEAFFKSFDKFEKKSRPEPYPWRYEAKHDGVRFFCISETEVKTDEEN